MWSSRKLYRLNQDLLQGSESEWVGVLLSIDDVDRSQLSILSRIPSSSLLANPITTVEWSGL
jgi:hypothetical protein